MTVKAVQEHLMTVVPTGDMSSAPFRDVGEPGGVLWEGMAAAGKLDEPVAVSSAYAARCSCGWELVEVSTSHAAARLGRRHVESPLG